MKRANNEGSITILPDGSAQARISVKGKRPSKRFYGPDAETLAKAWVRNNLTDVSRGINILPITTTINELAEAWLAARKISVGKNTYVKYEGYLNKHVLADLGDAAVCDVNPQIWINSKSEKLSPATVRQLWSVLRSILEDALDQDLIRKLPRVRLPKMVEREPDPLTTEQMAYLLRAADASKSKYAFGLWLAIGCGLRRSEMLALDWKDIDFGKKKIKIRRAVIRVKKEYIVKTPKTKAGRRDIDAPNFVLNKIKPLAQSEGLLFQTESGKYLSPWNWQRIFAAWLERADKAIEKDKTKAKEEKTPFVDVPKLAGTHFHDLRHQYATLLMLCGTSATVAQQMTGHDDTPTLINRYTHSTPGATRDAADKLDAMLQNIFPSEAAPVIPAPTAVTDPGTPPQ